MKRKPVLMADEKDKIIKRIVTLFSKYPDIDALETLQEAMGKFGILDKDAPEALKAYGVERKIHAVLHWARHNQVRAIKLSPASAKSSFMLARDSFEELARALSASEQYGVRNTQKGRGRPTLKHLRSPRKKS